MNRVDAPTFAVLLPTLLVAHNVADHVLQTDHQAAHKASNWAAMAGHVGSYLATAEAAVRVVESATGARIGWRARLAGHLFSCATHAFLDRRWPVKRALQLTGSADFAEMTTPLHGGYLADQALHHGCLFVAALLMARR